MKRIAIIFSVIVLGVFPLYSQKETIHDALYLNERNKKLFDYNDLKVNESDYRINSSSALKYGVISSDTEFNPAIYADSIIQELVSSYHLPGLSTIIVRNNETIWNKSYGYANVAQKKEVTDSTIFMLASISKTITTTALMQLWEDGLFGLDDDINDYLPDYLQVRNPNFPDDSITFRQLLTHTSSISYNWNAHGSLTTNGVDNPISLDSFLTAYLVPGGKYYSSITYGNWAPGTKDEYTNEGFALVGYLVEAISQTSFEEYCQQNIFIPLGMNESSWFLSGLDPDHIAIPYKNNTTAIGHYGFILYPAGQLRTSSSQLSRFIRAYLNWGELDGNRILDSTTVELITSFHHQIPDNEDLTLYQCLGWYTIKYPDFINPVFYHNGYVPGASTDAGFMHSGKEDIGVVVLSNGDSSTGSNGIFENLLRYAALYNKIYPYRMDLNAEYIKSNNDNLGVTANFYNPFNHIFNAYAIYSSMDSTVIDSVSLFDDGIHNDAIAGDGIWGNDLTTISQESEFMMNIATMDNETGEYCFKYDMGRFTTIGPLYIENISFKNTDTIPNPGDKINLYIELKNDGSFAKATNISAVLSSLDTLTNVTVKTRSYNDISAGESVKNSSSFQIQIPEELATNNEIKFKLDIFSNDHIFWRDTFSINVQSVGIEEIKRGSELKIYPNPTTSLLTIETEYPDHYSINITTLNGQKILTGEMEGTSHQIDLSPFSKGVYFITIRSKAFVTTRKILKL